jgi:heme exporter protein D
MMTQNQQILLICVLAAIMIGLFVYSSKQKRAHEQKMAQIRRDRKAAIEKAKQQSLDKS